MRFTLTIDCDGAAFDPHDGCPFSPEPEVARILGKVAARLEDGRGTVRDLNGNTVGRWAFDENEG